jgi:hypothetical protein
MGPVEKHRAYFELLERLPQGGCFVCGAVRSGMDSYLRTYLEEGVTNEKSWGALKASQGWCARHARQLEAKADGLAVALFYGHLLEEALVQVEAGTGKLERLMAGLSPGKPAPCPGCLREHESESSWAHLLAQAAGEAEAQDLMRPHLSLCVGHLKLALRFAQGEALAFLRADQGAKLRSLARENSEFVSKTGANGRGAQGLGAEADSWKRALRAWYGLHWGA